MDDDDKIRRNLVVTSAFIIGVAWFDVSLPDVLERLFSVKSQAGTPGAVVQLSTWKVWVAALVVLGYMSWRYRWSDEVEQATRLFTESVVSRYKKLFGDVYMTDVTKWFQSGAFPADVHPQLSAAYAQLVPHTLAQQLGRGPEKVTFTGPMPAINQGNHMMTMTAEWLPGGGGVYVNQQQVNIYIDTRRLKSMIWSARRFALANSKSSMSLVWPVVIAGSATVVVLYKLGRAVFG
jgi:hypothetical protein